MSFFASPVFAQAAQTPPAAAPQSPAAAPAAPAAAAPSAPAAAPQSPVAGAPQSPAAAPAQAPATGATATTVVPPAAPAAQESPGSGYTFIFIAVMILAMWFLMIRPQQKREKEIRKKQSELKVGDQVVTTAGMYGKVVNINNDNNTVTLQLGEGVRIVFQKQAIVGFSQSNDSTEKK